MLPTDAAATKIQARARGMIDRKKVKEKRRRYRKHPRPASASIAPTGAAQAPRAVSAKAALGTSKDRALMRGIAKDAGSSIVGLPGGGASASAPPFQSLFGDSSTAPPSAQVRDVPQPVRAEGTVAREAPLSKEEGRQADSAQDTALLRAEVASLQSQREQLQQTVVGLQNALAKAEGRCAALEETTTTKTSDTDPLPHASNSGSRTVNPRTEQEKAAAKRYLDAQQVHAVLKDLVAELVLAQPSNALRHMHSRLGYLVDASATDKENAAPTNTPHSKTECGLNAKPEQAWRMRMFVECTGPQGAGTRCNFSRIAKVGARVGTGERTVPPVMEWARDAAIELQKALQGNWGIEDFAPPPELRISVAST